MVLKTRSCSLLTTPSRSSPRDAIAGRVDKKMAAGGVLGGDGNSVTGVDHRRGSLVNSW